MPTPVLLEAAINGTTTKARNPNVPRTPAEITADALEKHGLYQLMRAKGTTLRVARQSMSARMSTATEARTSAAPSAIVPGDSYPTAPSRQ